MWKNQGSWNFFHTKLIPNSSNSSFTALNVAKIMCKELGTSIGRLKAKMINAYYAKRIIDVFEKNPNTPLNKESVNDIFSFADDAA